LPRQLALVVLVQPAKGFQVIGPMVKLSGKQPNEKLFGSNPSHIDLGIWI
jgi:hypothetical protein